jgi:putative Holliday junction resolvase
LTHAEATALTLLGVDWGTRRIGLAIKPRGQGWPLPREVLTVRDEADAIARLRGAIADAEADGVVVGLPEYGDPRMTEAVRRFCRKARRGMQGVRWFFVDETLTSQAAEALDAASSGRRRSDDLAAALILKTFMQACP